MKCLFKKPMFPLVSMGLFLFLGSTGFMEFPLIAKKPAQPPIGSPVVSPKLLPSLDFGKVPLYFIPNRGQVAAEALFYVKASKYTLWASKEGLTFDSIKRAEKKPTEALFPSVANDKGNSSKQRENSRSVVLRAPESAAEREVSRLVFLNSNPETKVVPLEETSHKVNYFIGNKPDQWRTNIPTSRAILYQEIYKNIDLKVYGTEDQVEYDWTVKPGGDVADIRFEYKDVKDTGIDEDGNLVIRTEIGDLMHKKPESFQMNGTQRAEVEIVFKKHEGNIYGFESGEYDRNLELVIDPMILIYSSYLGGEYNETAYGIAVDVNGNAYLAGHTYSADFPTINGYQTTFKGNDAFVTKFSATGASLEYSTFFGGTKTEYAWHIAVDTTGSAYIVGDTLSTDLPVQNAFQGTYGGGNYYGDAFAARFSSDGSSLIYSTYLGGWAWEMGMGIAVDGDSSAYVTGWTNSSNFPTNNAYLPTGPGGPYYGDAFVAKFLSDGSNAFSTYLGGSEDEEGYAIAVDGSGCAYVTGYTESSDYPVQNAFQGDFGGGNRDAFVTKFAANGQSLIHSTYLGGEGGDTGYGIAVDSEGSAYVCGQTGSASFPTKNPFQGNLKDWDGDAFVTKFSSAGDSLAYSSYLGGSNADWSQGIAVDAQGNAYITGNARSLDFPTLNAYQPDKGDRSLFQYYDGFVAKILAIGSSLVYSSYLGGSQDDRAWDISVDANGNAYVAGDTSSPDFPLQSPYQPALLGGGDAFVTKLSYSIQRNDFIGTWDGQGVYFRNSETGKWVKLASPANLVAAGDLGGDGIDDLITVFPSVAGVWTRSSSAGTWTKLNSTTAKHISSGDMDGDGREDVLATWDGWGVYYRNSVSGAWTKIAQPASLLASGDLDGDHKDDPIIIFPAPAGVWVKYSKTGAWSKLSSTSAIDIASADMDSDGRDDLLGTWEGTGVYYRDSISGGWVKMAVPGEQVTAGDLDGDGKDDLIGLWTGQGGVWVKYSKTGAWSKLSTPVKDMTAGLMRGGIWGSIQSGFIELQGPFGGYAEGPLSQVGYIDLSNEGPGGWRFAAQEEQSLIPKASGLATMTVPGPGEPGFRCTEQKNLLPQEGIDTQRPKDRHKALQKKEARGNEKK